MQILQEQIDFVKDIDSYQVEGITEREMHSTEDGIETIKQILLQGPGVQAVEPTYQTKHKGQWILVVKGHKVNQLTGFIKQNISRIYKNKTGPQTRLVTHQAASKNEGYKLSLLENKVSKVGTYAEVLKRRFISPTTTDRNKGVHKMAIQNKEKQGNGDTFPKESLKYSSTNTSDTPVNQTRDSLEDESPNTTMEQNFTEHESPTIKEQKAHDDIDNNQNEDTIQRRMERKTDSTGKVRNTEQSNEWSSDIRTMEKVFTTKLESFEEENRTLMKELEQRIEEQVDRIMEKRFRDISRAVGNSVTKRVMIAMNKMFARINSDTENTDRDNAEMTVTQDSPLKDSSNSEINRDLKNNDVTPEKQEMNSTQKMLSALENIHSNISDPTHDINAQGSGTTQT